MIKFCKSESCLSDPSIVPRCGYVHCARRKEFECRFSEDQRRCGPDYCHFFRDQEPGFKVFQQRCMLRVIDRIYPWLHIFPPAKFAYCPKEYTDAQFDKAKATIRALSGATASENDAFQSFRRAKLCTLSQLLSTMRLSAHVPQRRDPDQDLHPLLFAMFQTDFVYPNYSCSGSLRDHGGKEYHESTRSRQNRTDGDGRAPYHGWLTAIGYGADSRLDLFVEALRRIEGIEVEFDDGAAGKLLDIEVRVPDSLLVNPTDRMWLTRLWEECAGVARGFVPKMNADDILRVSAEFGPAAELFPALFV